MILNRPWKEINQVITMLSSFKSFKEKCCNTLVSEDIWDKHNWYVHSCVVIPVWFARVAVTQ